MDAPTKDTAPQEPSVSTQDYIDAIKEAKVNGRSLSINYGSLPDGVVAAAIHTAMSDGLPQEYQDAIGEAASRGKTISLDFSQIKPQAPQGMAGVAQEAIKTALPSPDYATPIQGQTSGGLAQTPMAALNAAIQTLRDPTRINATTAQPGQLAGEQVQQAIGPNHPVLGKAANFLTSLALDPNTYTMGGITNKANIIDKPIVPADRLLSVKAAQEAGIPLTRAEMTGGRVAGNIESGLEKTITGSDPINAVRQQQTEKLSGLLDKLTKESGPQASPNTVGQATQGILDAAQQARKMAAQDLYKQVPSMPVKLSNFGRISEDILTSQKALPSSNQDTALIKAATEYSDLASKSSKYVDQWGRSNSSQLMPKTPVSLDVLRSIQSDASANSVNNALSPTSRAAWGKMAHAINTDIEALGNSSDALTKYMGAEAVTKLKQANEAWAGMKQIDELPIVKAIRASKPEDVADKIFKAGNVSDVQAAKTALGDMGFKAAKTQYLAELINNPQLGKALSKMDGDFRAAVLTSDETATLNKIVGLRQLLGSAEKMGAQQGSARSNAVMGNAGAIGAALYTAVQSLFHGNLIGAATGLGAAGAMYKGPELMANAYLKYGTKGLTATIPTGAAAVGANKGLNVLRSYLEKQRQNGR